MLYAQHACSVTITTAALVNNNLNVFACPCVLHTIVRNPSRVFGHYVVKFLLGRAEHPRSWALGRLQPTE